MTEEKQLILFGHTLPGNENLLLERIKECADKRNKGFCSTSPGCTILQKLPAENILQVTAGHNYVAFLLNDNRIVRLRYELVTNAIESSAPNEKNESGPSGSSTTGAVSTTAGSTDTAPSSTNAAANAANRTAKIRRIMMTRPGTRSGGFCRTGVVIDRNRSRPLLPASSVPEDLIVQCQVVLQGKSRDVIVRELQRTNLNVNEAVNNLLSRDDDEMDDLDDTSEAYLHEELLSLLDAGLRSDSSGAAAAALLDSDSIYSAGDGYEYLISRDLAKRKGEDKTKDQNKDNKDTSQSFQEHFLLDERLIYWGLEDNDVGDGSTKFQFPSNVKKFVKIVSMHSELIALADNGKLYGWSWDLDSIPNNSLHSANHLLFSDTEDFDTIISMESCGLRTVVLTKNGCVGSFVDISCGSKLGKILCEQPIHFTEPVDKLLCCTLYSAVLTKDGNIFWRGIYPFNERRKLWEKIRSRKKQVTFESGGTEIVVGSEVRTKSTPIYSFGSLAVNFSQGIPMIGILYEDAWTLNETCRFRVFGSAAAFDNYQGEKLQQQKEKRVSFNLSGNRKRSAPSAQVENDQQASTVQASTPENNANISSAFAGKESAWNLKDCIFIHEEAINDTSIVKIVDGAYCGIVFKSTLEKLEADNELSLDLSKLGIRLMRKDDLVLVSASSRCSRSPENFQSQFKQIRLPSSIRRVLSVAVDLTGFRILCEKRSRVHLLRISCVGKLLSDHPIPVNFGALTPNKDDINEFSSTIENYGDDSILLMHDSVGGSFQPLLRNITGGYKQFSYTGLGRVLQFGMGIRFFTSIDIRNSCICSEQLNMDKKNRNHLTNKGANRLLLIVALVSPNPVNALTEYGSLVQAILFCQLDVVLRILTNLLTFPIEKQPAIVCEQAEGNRNIFHIAVQNAYSRTNVDQADLDATDSKLTAISKTDTVEAEATKIRYDRKWQEMISSPLTTRAKAQQQQRQLLSELTTDTSKKDSSTEANNESVEMTDLSDITINKKIPVSAKERQADSIEIIRELCKNGVIREYFIELMRQRDINGQSPFESAIYHRAYSAAQLMWQTAIDVREWSQDIVDILMPSVGSDDSTDDNALFILCANDTCSYTWTGEEHTPQKIYECKTCGLVGTLCCCTECALICHRNHDCKLKKTSPTAYCDCWEKCECKALVAGNTAKREQLLSVMLQCHQLIDSLNSKGDHILLFLARTVGRQLIEQEGYTKRSKRPGPTSTTAANGTTIPEHDLEPPKFARKALDLAIGNWDVVKSLLYIGIKKFKKITSSNTRNCNEDDEPVLENVFHLLEHNGSTHLDKFVLTLLGWCDDSSLDTLLNLLVRQANKQLKKPDDEVHFLIQRFVRSVIRLFVMVILLSPNANGTLLATIFDDINKAIPASDAPSLIYPLTTQSNSSQPGTSTTSAVAALRDSLQNYRAAAISGVLSLVRASLPAALSLNSSSNEKKDQKKTKIIAFVAKCRRVFQTLISYSLLELIGVSDVLISPVRSGIVKSNASIVSNEDVLDVLQQHLSNERDLSSLLRISMQGGGHTETLVDMRRGDTSQATDLVMERSSDDDMSNDDDDDEDDLDMPALVSRTRENSSNSFSVRERTISEQSRRRQETATGLEESLDDHEAEDAYGSDHDIDDDDDDDEVEPYFDIHDDDDDDDDGDGQGGSDVNPLDGEGDSNDTATVTIGGPLTTSSAETANSINGEGSNASATISIEQGARQADSQTQIAVSASESASRIGATTTNLTSNISGDSSRRGGLGWGESINFDETSWVRNNNNNALVSGTNNRTPTDPRSTVLRSTTANSTTASTSANDSVNLGGSGGTSLPLAAQSTHGTDNNAVVNLGDSGDFAFSNTSTQLCACFSTLVKLIDELLLQLFFYENYKIQNNKQKGIINILELDPKFFNIFKDAFDECLDPTWNWFYSIMDKTEAQLRYSNALMNSSVSHLLNSNQIELSDATEERREDQQRSLTSQRNRTSEQKKPLTKRVNTGTKRIGDGNGETGDSPDMARTEYISYIFSLLRCYSSENGDDLPVLEFNALRDMAFITEAYLFHICFGDQLENAKLSSVVSVKNSRFTRGQSEIRQEDNDEQKKKKLRQFFRRSNSISYSTLSDIDKHHAFTYTAANALPLSARPYLLNAEAERDVLFALPPPYRTKSLHRSIAFEHGIKFPAHQSLSQPPMSYAELQNRLFQSEGDKGSLSFKKISRETRRDSIDMDICTSTDDSTAKQLSFPICNTMQRSIGRWNRTISFIARTFHDDITKWFGGDSSHSVLIHKTGVCSFNVRYSQFRKQMDRLKSLQTKDLVFSQMPREKYVLLQQTFRQLNHHYVRRMSGASGTSSLSATPSGQQLSGARTSAAVAGGLGRALPLASHKVKVTFRDEPGEGTGVARHFYAAVAEALISVKHLPSLENVNEDGTSKSDSSKNVGKSASVGPTTPCAPKSEDSGRTLRSSTINATNTPAEGVTSVSALMPTPSTPALSINSFILPVGSEQPLFYKASAKSGGFFTPITGVSCTSQRLNAFRNVGRLIGICLQHMEIFPLPLSRYVFKYILGRNINWYDMAFFDTALFDSLRSIVYNEVDENFQSEDFFNQLEMTFAVDLPTEEGGGTLELKPGGADISVTSENVLEYIYLFVENRLIGRNKASLDAMRRGVFDVLPADALINLTAEDMRLILCGSSNINLQILQSFTKFFDESSAPANLLAKYKKNFWIVVNKFSNAEKQDLCFFWTGSPNLPSTEEGFQPLPTIMIRPADDVHLPTANTCISRLYVPLYSSKKILASKLLLAIKAHNFGFV